MTKNAILNAFAALAYIALIVQIISTFEHAAGPDTILIPIGMLSLLVLSAATMGYLFFYQPVQLYLDGHKKQGVELFLRTLGIFAGITVVLLISIYLLNH